MAYNDDRTYKEAFDAQHPRIGRFWGLTKKVGGTQHIIERHTKSTSSGDSESPFTDFEVVLIETFKNCLYRCSTPMGVDFS